MSNTKLFWYISLFKSNGWYDVLDVEVKLLFVLLIIFSIFSFSVANSSKNSFVKIELIYLTSLSSFIEIYSKIFEEYIFSYSNSVLSFFSSSFLQDNIK